MGPGPGPGPARPADGRSAGRAGACRHGPRAQAHWPMIWFFMFLCVQLKWVLILCKCQSNSRCWGKTNVSRFMRKWCNFLRVMEPMESFPGSLRLTTLVNWTAGCKPKMPMHTFAPHRMKQVRIVWNTVFEVVLNSMVQGMLLLAHLTCWQVANNVQSQVKHIMTRARAIGVREFIDVHGFDWIWGSWK